MQVAHELVVHHTQIASSLTAIGRDAQRRTASAAVNSHVRGVGASPLPVTATGRGFSSPQPQMGVGWQPVKAGMQSGSTSRVRKHRQLIIVWLPARRSGRRASAGIPFQPRGTSRGPISTCHRTPPRSECCRGSSPRGRGSRSRQTYSGANVRALSHAQSTPQTPTLDQDGSSLAGRSGLAGAARHQSGSARVR